MIGKAGNNCKTLRCTAGHGCLVLRHSGAGPGAEEKCSSPSKGVLESAKSTWGAQALQEKVSHPRKCPHSPKKLVSGSHHWTPQAAVLVWHPAVAERMNSPLEQLVFMVSDSWGSSWSADHLAEQSTPFCQGQTWHPLCRRYWLSHELLSREGTHIPSLFLPKRDLNSIFNKKYEKISQTVEKSDMPDLILLPELFFGNFRWHPQEHQPHGAPQSASWHSGDCWTYITFISAVPLLLPKQQTKYSSRT